MTPEAIRRLYDYVFWAFERVWDCVTPLTDEQFIQELDYSMGSIRNHLVHLASAKQRWLKRAQGHLYAEIPLELRNADYSNRETVRAAWDEIKADIQAYLNGITQAELDEIIECDFPHRGFTLHNPRYLFLMHLANHATDHYAQIMAMLHTHFGAKTLEIDMLFYLAETR